jgi:hypothetical protein
MAAQNPPAKKAPAEQSAVESVQPRDPALQRTIAVLDGVLEAQKSFADENLRVMIRANVADMLWSHNEPRARRLFEDAVHASEKLADQDTRPPQAGVSLYPVRAQVIRLIIPHDPDWAARLIESRGELFTDLTSRSIARNRERTLLQMQIVIFFAQRDPQRAAVAAKPLAEVDDLNGLMSLLSMIRFRDVKAADELFLLALAKTRARQPTLEDIRRFAMYLFPSFGEGLFHFASDGSKRDPVSPPNSSPGVVERFFEFSFEVVTRRLQAGLAATNGVHFQVPEYYDFAIPKLLEPYFDRFMPDKATEYRALVKKLRLRVPAGERQYLLLTEPGTIEELLSRANTTADPGLRYALIRRSVFQASDRDFEQAAALIERLSSDDARSNARNQLRQRIDSKRSNDAWAALNDNDLDKAEALAAEISDWRSQGLLVRSLVGRLAYKDKSRAARVLDGYEQKAAVITDPHERALALIQLAGVAATIDLNRGFEEMNRAIAEFNSAGFMPELERYIDNYTGVGAGSPAVKVNIGLGGLLNDWDLHWLGRTSFDRSVALTQQFQLKEAGALILLNICRGALSLPPSAR